MVNFYPDKDWFFVHIEEGVRTVTPVVGWSLRSDGRIIGMIPQKKDADVILGLSHPPSGYSSYKRLEQLSDEELILLKSGYSLNNI